jgi:hypothetical protein
MIGAFDLADCLTVTRYEFSDYRPSAPLGFRPRSAGATARPSRCSVEAMKSAAPMGRLLTLLVSKRRAPSFSERRLQQVGEARHRLQRRRNADERIVAAGERTARPHPLWL